MGLQTARTKNIIVGNRLSWGVCRRATVPPQSSISSRLCHKLHRHVAGAFESCLHARMWSSTVTATSGCLCTRLVSFVQCSSPLGDTSTRCWTAASAAGRGLVDNIDCARPYCNELQGIAAARPEDTQTVGRSVVPPSVEATRLEYLSRCCRRRPPAAAAGGQAVVAECYGADKRQQTRSIDGRISCRWMKEYGLMNEWVWCFATVRPRYTSRQLPASAY
jgi:hypothetical protein